MTSRGLPSDSTCVLKAESGKLDNKRCEPYFFCQFTHCFTLQTNDMTYTDAHLFVLQIRVSCAFSMRCTHVRFKVRWKRETTHINNRQDYEYSSEMISVSALTNQVAYLEKSILKCVDSVIGKSNLKFEIRYIFFCFCCFTSHVNSYGHCGTASSLNHTFSWAGLSKRLTSNLCTYFRL